MFNQFDHAYIGLISMTLSPSGLGMIVLFFILIKITLLRKTPLIFNLISVFVLLATLLIYHLNFSKTKCLDYFNLTLEQCSFSFIDQPTNPNDEMFLYFEIKRNEKPELNGYVLGKDKASFEIKQRSYYVLIRPSMKFKNNESLLFLEKEQKNVLSQVQKFLDGGDKL